LLIKYIGSGDEPPEKCTAFGSKFKRGGKPVEVTDAHAIEKLSANPSFEAVKSGEAKKAPAKKVAAKKGPGRPKKSAVPELAE
jgi:hypothetical protein